MFKPNAKFTRKIHTLALGVALLASTSLSVALAADTNAAGNKPAETSVWGGKHSHSGKHKGCGAMSKLGLSEEQKNRLQAAHKAFREENKAAFESMKAKHQQLKQLGTDPANEAQRQQLRSELKQEKEGLHAKRKASMQGILTPEQESKWQALKKECMAKHKGHKGNHKPDGPQAN